jgi:hypothetical protein
MSEITALVFLILHLVESEDPVKAFLALNPLEQLGLAALVAAGIAITFKVFGKRK